MDKVEKNGMKYEQVIEGNLAAVKDISGFGGPNNWNLNVKTINGNWESVQWMGVRNIQVFFKTKLTVYNEEETKKYSVKN